MDANIEIFSLLTK